MQTETPTMDELNSLTYLDWVVREGLRVNSISPYVERMAYNDDVIPFEKKFEDRDGNIRDTLP